MYVIRSWQFMKVIRDIHSLIQEESLEIKNNQPILPHIALLIYLCCIKNYRKHNQKKAYGIFNLQFTRQETAFFSLGINKV
jgi:hypothetical protein